MHIYCQKLKLDVPQFDVKKNGPDHLPVYMVECTFQNLAVRASAPTIKSAKEAAMTKLVENLKIPDDFFKRETTYFIDYNEPMSEVWNTDHSKTYILTMRKKTGSCDQAKKFRAVIERVD